VHGTVGRDVGGFHQQWGFHWGGRRGKWAAFIKKVKSSCMSRVGMQTVDSAGGTVEGRIADES